MEATTAAQPRLDTGLTCEAYVSTSRVTSRTCGKPAAFAGRRWARVGSEPEALCKMHAAAIRRRQWSNPLDVQYLDDEKVEAIRARLAEQKRRAAIEAASKRHLAEQRHAERVEREWSELGYPFTMSLDIDESWEPDVIRGLTVYVHPVGERRDSYSSSRVELTANDADLPAYVRVHAGQTQTPAGALALAEAIQLVAGWVAEVNEK